VAFGVWLPFRRRDLGSAAFISWSRGGMAGRWIPAGTRSLLFGLAGQGPPGS